ncbi:MAG TPA: GAF domain-containing protein [Alphaproteobacteria bacterium]|nr:GAF domain-containing protein [Alphaproteobacteria bacterium]
MTLTTERERLATSSGSEHRFHRLTLLSQLSTRVTAITDPTEVLQEVVNAAAQLIGARYAALAVFDASGRVATFLTYGITPEERARIGHYPEGRGLLGLLQKVQRPLRLADLTQHPASVGFPAHHPFMKSFLGAPIRHGGETLGNLYLTEKEGGGEFTEEDEELLVLFAAQAGVAIRNAQLQERARVRAEEAERAVRDLELLYSLTRVSVSTTDIKQILDHALPLLVHEAAADAVEVWLLNSASGTLELQGWAGDSAVTLLDRRTLQLGESLLGIAAQTLQPVISLDLANDERFRRRHLVEAGFRAFGAFPMAVQGRPVGVLGAAYRDANRCAQQSVTLMERAADSLALALHNARLFNRVQEQAVYLRALHEAALLVMSDLSLERILQRFVDLARELIQARYAALAVVNREGHWEQFYTSGMSNEERQRIGNLPTGRGLLGLVLREGRSIRLADLTQHPNFSGFPPHHPPMKTLLGVPVFYQGEVRGLLYLTEKENAPEFSETDEEIANLFAAYASVAVSNAVLHARVQHAVIEEERQRIAREMHDGLAQVLAYVNAKTGAVRRLVELDRREEALQELAELEAAAREVYADVRESILGLRVITQGGPGFLAALRQYAEQFSRQSGVPVDLRIEGPEEGLEVEPMTEVQLIRVVQEALSNVRKHAAAHRAEVRLYRENSDLCLTIADDGRGFDPHLVGRGESPRFGLQTMRERVESLGGTFTITSAPGHGTVVSVSIPLRRR